MSHLFSALSGKSSALNVVLWAPVSGYSSVCECVCPCMHACMHVCVCVCVCVSPISSAPCVLSLVH